MPHEHRDGEDLNALSARQRPNALARPCTATSGSAHYVAGRRPRRSDHAVPFDGTEDESNLQALCVHCNLAKGRRVTRQMVDPRVADVPAEPGPYSGPGPRLD
jgi:5-methylcytosine-specific restriction endonuclease McrA